MSIKTVRNRIITLLEAIQVAAGFDDTYYEMPTELEATPAVAVLTDGGSEIALSWSDNDQEIQFRVRCMVEKLTNSANQDKTQTDKLLDLVDDVLAELRKKANETLSGDAYALDFPTYESLQVGQVGNMHVFYIDVLVRARGCKSVL